MSKERKSQRVSYAENREKYFDTVVKLFSQGMTAKEIADIVPIGKPFESHLHLPLRLLHSSSRVDATNYTSLCPIVHSPLILPHNNYGVRVMKTKNTPIPNSYSFFG